MSLSAAAAAHAENAEGMTAEDCEPNELLDEARFCTLCEHGHGGHVCRWCIASGRTP